MQDYPADVMAVTGAAIFYSDRGMVKQARENFDKALRINPKFHIALLGRARFLASYFPDEAPLAFENALQVFPNDHEIVLAYARYFQAQGQYAKSLALYDSVPDQEKPKVFFSSKGRCQQEMKNFLGAITTFENGLAIYPKDVELMVSEVYCLEDMGNIVSADMLVCKLMEDNKNHEDWHVLFAYGKYLRRQEKYSEAKKVYDKCLSLRPGDRSTLIAIAYNLENLRQFDAAIAVFDSALQLYGNDRVILLSKARCLEEKGDLEEALKKFNEALDFFRGDRELLLGKARCVMVQRESDKWPCSKRDK
jgi:tetratricopeptide (TPR) repeat protein